jgi:hypothetical protein
MPLISDFFKAEIKKISSNITHLGELIISDLKSNRLLEIRRISILSGIYPPSELVEERGAGGPNPEFQSLLSLLKKGAWGLPRKRGCLKSPLCNSV